MSRDGNGNYTLPLGAVATGEVIASTWANTSLDDIAAAMTDSLARSGNGGMLAPFRATDGTINAPSLSFNNETNSGVYRSSAGDYRLCVNGKDKARIRDVNGMAAFQVFDLAGTGAWETLAKAADVAALSLATVLAIGNTTGGTDLSVSAADDLLLTDTSKIIASNGLAGSLERTCQLYVDGPNNGVVKFQSKGNNLAISSDTNVTLGSFADWPMVTVTQVDARLSYGVGAGVNLVKLQTTTTGVTVTGTVDADGFSGTGIVAITDFVTDVSTNDNDTTVPTTAAVKSYVDTFGGNETLAQTLVLGKVTGGTDIEISTGDVLTSVAGSNVNIKAATSAGVVLASSAGIERVYATETSVSLYHGATASDGTKVLETTAAGIDITGQLTVTDRVTAKEITAPNTYVNSTASVMLNAQNWNGQQVWNKHNGNSTVTLPSDLLAAIGFSTTISIMSSGYTMTITPDTGDTIKYLDPLTSTWSGTVNTDLVVGSGGVIELIRTATGEWTVYGSGVV